MNIALRVEGGFTPVAHAAGRKETLLSKLEKNGISPSALHRGVEVLRQHASNYGTLKRRGDVFAVTSRIEEMPATVDDAVLQTGNAINRLQQTAHPDILITPYFHPVEVVNLQTIQAVRANAKVEQEVVGLVDVWGEYPPYVMLGAVDLRNNTVMTMASLDPLARISPSIEEFI